MNSAGHAQECFKQSSTNNFSNAIAAIRGSAIVVTPEEEATNLLAYGIQVNKCLSPPDIIVVERTHLQLVPTRQLASHYLKLRIKDCLFFKPPLMIQIPSTLSCSTTGVVTYGTQQCLR